MGPQDPSARLLGQTGPERPVSHEKCPTAARLASPAFARPSPLYSRSRTSGQFLLFTMSNAGFVAGGNQKTEFRRRKTLPTSLSGFWLLISLFWFGQIDKTGLPSRSCGKQPPAFALRATAWQPAYISAWQARCSRCSHLACQAEAQSAKAGGR